MWTRLIDQFPPKAGRYLTFHDGGYDITFFDSHGVFKKSQNTDIASWFWMELPEAPGTPSTLF